MPKCDRSLFMREFMKEKRDAKKRIKYLLEECNIIGRGNCVYLDSDIQKIFEVSGDVHSDILMFLMTLPENKFCLSKVESNYGDVDDIAVENSLYSSIDTLTSTRDFLYKWSLKYCIKDDALNALLFHLNKFTPSTPKCRQTLQKSLQKVNVLYVSGSDYIYLGVESAIDYYISTVGNKEKLDLIVSIDGAPMYNSKKTSIWPILITTHRKGSNAVAIWYGQEKPNNLDENFEDFILEMKKLQTNGYKQLQVTIKAFVSDVAARAFVKCIIGHSGYHSCERYMAVGKQKRGVRLLETTALLCTDMAFKNNLYKEEGHQLKSLSPLVQLNFPMVTGFPLNYMHLIFLGVVKKLLINWCKGAQSIRINQSVKDSISNELINLRSYTPSNFQHQHFKTTLFK
ncbi:uncharacterized protein LOC136088979 isoform X1 [Hydra vulgaris]|uniref:Uncharacterized protein LOC136088979 isoform X1 n=1 Tax=Hydra vulgaris TaxID=6087 RepID=A0ABM4D7R2_HYDVU